MREIYFVLKICDCKNIIIIFSPALILLAVLERKPMNLTSSLLNCSEKANLRPTSQCLGVQIPATEIDCGTIQHIGIRVERRLEGVSRCVGISFSGTARARLSEP